MTRPKKVIAGAANPLFGKFEHNPIFTITIDEIKSLTEKYLETNQDIAAKITAATNQGNPGRSQWIRWQLEFRYWYAICQYYGLGGIEQNCKDGIEKLKTIVKSSQKASESAQEAGVSFYEIAKLFVSIQSISEVSEFLYKKPEQTSKNSIKQDRNKMLRATRTLSSFTIPNLWYGEFFYEDAYKGILYQQLADLFMFKQRTFGGIKEQQCQDSKSICNLQIKINIQDRRLAYLLHCEAANYNNSISLMWLSRWAYEIFENSNIDTNQAIYLIEFFNIIRQRYNKRCAEVEFENTIKPVFVTHFESLNFDSCNSAIFRNISLYFAYISALCGNPEAYKVLLQFSIIDNIGDDAFKELLVYNYLLNAYYTKHFKIKCSSVVDPTEIYKKLRNRIESGMATSDCLKQLKTDPEVGGYFPFFVARETETLINKKVSSPGNEVYNYIGFSEWEPRANFVFSGDQSLKSVVQKFDAMSAVQLYQPALSHVIVHRKKSYSPF